MLSNFDNDIHISDKWKALIIWIYFWGNLLLRTWLAAWISAAITASVSGTHRIHDCSHLLRAAILAWIAAGVCHHLNIILRICKNNSSQLKKCYFTGNKILMLKHFYFAWCNIDTHCHLAVNFVSRNKSFLPQHKKTGNLMADIIKISFFFLFFFELWRFSRICAISMKDKTYVYVGNYCKILDFFYQSYLK